MAKKPFIKFSHEYQKLGLVGDDGDQVKRAVLLEVIFVKMESLSPQFLNYDTDFGKYQLPKSGDYMLLIFQAFDDLKPLGLFTTLRRWTQGKDFYYRSLIGQLFDVVIQE